jgi:hypothetical protein
MKMFERKNRKCEGIRRKTKGKGEIEFKRVK